MWRHLLVTGGTSSVHGAELEHLFIFDKKKNVVTMFLEVCEAVFF